MLYGIEDTNVVVFSVNGSMIEPKQKDLLIKAIHQTVDSLTRLEKIIVYRACSNDENVLSLFKYAIEKNIEIIIPDNILKRQNS